MYFSLFVLTIQFIMRSFLRVFYFLLVLWMINITFIHFCDRFQRMLYSSLNVTFFHFFSSIKYWKPNNEKLFKDYLFYQCNNPNFQTHKNLILQFFKINLIISCLILLLSNSKRYVYSKRAFLSI